MSFPNPSQPFLVNGAGSPQSIYAVSENKHHELGTKAVTTDGRTFFYASSVAAAALNRGELATKAATVGDHTSVAYASGGAAGSNKITVTLGSTLASANQYADGWLSVIDGGTTKGQGQLRKILSHPAADSAATLELTLYDTLETAVSATATELSLIANLYSSVIVSPGNAQPLPLGWPQCNVPIGSTDTQYFWLQTYGEGIVLGDGSTFVDGIAIVPASAGTADAGQVTIAVEATGTAASDLMPIVGYIVEADDASSDGDHRLAFMTIRA